jgi:hypothetical protein
MIGNSGVTLQIGRLQWLTPGTPVADRPPNTPAGFTGLYLDDVLSDFRACLFRLANSRWMTCSSAPAALAARRN